MSHVEFGGIISSLYWLDGSLIGWDHHLVSAKKLNNQGQVPIIFFQVFLNYLAVEKGLSVVKDE